MSTATTTLLAPSFRRAPSHNVAVHVLTFARSLCESILNKSLHVVAEDWPSFLFDVDMYKTTDATLLDCLFRSPLFKMVRVRICVWTVY